MICDTLDHLDQYRIITPYQKQIQYVLETIPPIFSSPHETIMLEDGCYAILTSYDTKPWNDTIRESHRCYHDLVLILQGEESIFCGYSDYEAIVRTPYDTAHDIILYEEFKELIHLHMRPGMFVLFTPSDLHHPYCIDQRISHIQKITFKLPVFNRLPMNKQKLVF